MKNFIWDIDRTLVDSFMAEKETLKEALYIVTGKHYNDSIMKMLAASTTDEFFKSINIEKDSEELKQINYNWGRLLNEREIKFFDGIKEVLVKLKEQGCFLAIVTSRTNKEFEELDNLKEELKLFTEIITSDMVEKPKPSPESMNLIIDKYNLNKEETVYIGDSSGDHLAAKAAEIKFCYAAWENKDSIKEYDYIATKPQEILELLEK